MRPDLREHRAGRPVAQAIVRMASDPAAAGSTFHLTAPTETLPTARQMVEVVRAWARRR